MYTCSSRPLLLCHNHIRLILLLQAGWGGSAQPAIHKPVPINPANPADIDTSEHFSVVKLRAQSLAQNPKSQLNKIAQSNSVSVLPSSNPLFSPWAASASEDAEKGEKKEKKAQTPAKNPMGDGGIRMDKVNFMLNTYPYTCIYMYICIYIYICVCM